MHVGIATLTEEGSGRAWPLSARSVVGRLHSCQLQLPSTIVSALHAQIVWDGTGWTIQDLSSKNGTFVNGRRLSAGTPVPLLEGAVVGFGAPEHRCRLVNASPPQLMATPDGGETVVAHDDVLCLPTTEAAELTIYCDNDRHWIVETNTGERPLEDQEIVTAGNRSWRIGLPGLIARTSDTVLPGAPDLRDASLRLVVSRDGEHLTATLAQGDTVIELEYRAHLFLLLELARARLTDAADASVLPSEHGWVYREDLLSALKIDETHLNIWVHRARQQLIRAKVRGTGSLFERRSGAGQLRIGIEKLSIA